MDLRLVEWLMGKLRFRWRRLISSQQEQCTLLSKVVQPHGSSHWAHLPCAPSLSSQLTHWTAGLPPALVFRLGLTFTSRAELCLTSVLVSKVWKPSVKLSSAPPLQPPPPALQSCPEPSSVLPGYEWSQRCLYPAKGDLVGEWLLSLGALLVADPLIHPWMSQPEEP